MDKEKRMIILREIDYWRTSKLLPDQYCDFLTNLYTEGDGGTAGPAKGRSLLTKPAVHNYVLALCSLLSLILLFVLYFAPIHRALQVAFNTLALIPLYSFGFFRRFARPITAQVSLGTASIYLLLSGVILLDHGGSSSNEIAVYVAICAIVWMFTGVSSHIPLLHFCGWVTVLLSFGWWIRTSPHMDGIFWSQVVTIPIGMIILVCAILFVKQRKEDRIIMMLAAYGFVILAEICQYGIHLFSGIFALIGTISKTIVFVGIGTLMLRYKTNNATTSSSEVANE